MEKRLLEIHDTICGAEIDLEKALYMADTLESTVEILKKELVVYGNNLNTEIDIIRDYLNKASKEIEQAKTKIVDLSKEGSEQA